MSQLSPVTFHGDTIFCLTHENQPYTPMKPIVENMGISWQGQQVKLTTNAERWGIKMILIPTASGQQDMLCMPVRKLPAYFSSINPKKVRPELRAKIELYQNESDDALWNYWINGRAERPTPDAPSPISKRTDPERKALTAIINTWVGMAPIHYASARAQVNAHFGVASVDALTIGQVRDAIQWVQEKIDALQKALPQSALPSLCAAHPVIDEKPFLEFIEEIQAAHEEVDRILSRLHHSVFTLSWKVAEALEQRADIRLYLIPDMLSENTLRGYLHQSVYHDVRKALTAPGRQLEQYSNPGYSLLGIVRQLNGNGRA